MDLTEPMVGCIVAKSLASPSQSDIVESSDTRKREPMLLLSALWLKALAETEEQAAGDGKRFW